jgi:hypothetical protein
MGLYISEDDVKIRLVGKIRFTDDLEDENKMPIALLRRLISEAEGHVEYDMSPRYEAPFVTDAGDAFKKLPERPTKETIRTMCELQSVIRVLETDFGRGTAVNGDEYAQKMRDRYQVMLDRIMKYKDGIGSGWFYPPLPGLKRAYHNTEADDGYSGMVVNSTTGIGDYPADRLDNPEQNYWSIFEDGSRSPNK